ncbi:MAG: hypothetical protein ACLQPV_00265 [Vulcanimicrobiaceae bacterium]
MIPLTRIVAIAMGGVLCFGVLVPLALAHGRVALAAGVCAVFVAYAIANVVLWRRMNSSP